MALPIAVTRFQYSVLLYQALNDVNGKRYIGITSTGFGKRVGRHFRTARLYQKGAAIGAAIRKYGQRNIKWSVLAVCPDWDYAKALEIAAIEKFKPEYNLTKGGDGAWGYRHSEDHKRAVSQRQKGNKHWLGKRHTPETIEKMRASAILCRAEGRGGFQKGVPHPWQKRRLPLKVTSVKSKVVTSTITGESFPSVSEAARSLQCQRSYIRNSGNFIVGWVVAPAL